MYILGGSWCVSLYCKQEKEKFPSVLHVDQVCVPGACGWLAHYTHHTFAAVLQEYVVEDISVHQPPLTQLA